MAGGGGVLLAQQNSPHKCFIVFVALYSLSEKQLMNPFSEVKEGWRGGVGVPGRMVPPGFAMPPKVGWLAGCVGVMVGVVSDWRGCVGVMVGVVSETLCASRLFCVLSASVVFVRRWVCMLALGGVLREQKMLKGHLHRVIYHRVY